MLRLTSLLCVFLGAISGAREAAEAGHSDDLSELQPAIDRAIDRGTEYLLSTQLRDGSWEAYMPKFLGGQTALAAYTLLKSGFKPDHPSVERALLFLEHHEPIDTYSLSLQLMAFGATRDERHIERMKGLVQRLLEWRNGTAWGYPWNYAGNAWLEGMGRTDLSNTQFAVLGLRAAEEMGIDAGPRVWTDLIEDTLGWRAPEEEIELDGAAGRTTTGKQRIGGFIYRHYSNRPPTPTLTMTEAGITVLAIASDALGKRLRGRSRRRVDRAIDSALAWLGAHFSLLNDNGKGDPWHFYHLYGFERVGSLCLVDRLGTHDWYLEGARFLVEKQGKDGSWKDMHAEPDTCFAVLFLERATRPASGVGSTQSHDDLHLAEDESYPLRIRGLGTQDLALFVTGFATQAPRILRVEYLIDGEVIARIEGNPALAWSGERFAAQYHFERRGTFRVTARADLEDGSTVDCPGFDVEIRRVDGAWALEAATAVDRNLIDAARVTASASSHHGGRLPLNAVDGLAATRWLCALSDGNAALLLEFSRPIRAKSLVLGQADASVVRAGECDRVTRVVVTINGRNPFEVELDADVVRNTKIALPRSVSVKRIEVRVIAREKGLRWPGLAGFSHVSLERD